MITPPDQPSDSPPTLTRYNAPLSALSLDRLIALSEQLTGRPATPDEIEKAKAILAARAPSSEEAEQSYRRPPKPSASVPPQE